MRNCILMRTVRAAKMPEYTERLAFEIGTIIKMGFPGYFLIVADFIRWAKKYRDPKFPNGVRSGRGAVPARARWWPIVSALPILIHFDTNYCLSVS